VKLREKVNYNFKFVRNGTSALTAKEARVTTGVGAVTIPEESFEDVDDATFIWVQQVWELRKNYMKCAVSGIPADSQPDIFARLWWYEFINPVFTFICTPENIEGGPGDGASYIETDENDITRVTFYTKVASISKTNHLIITPTIRTSIIVPKFERIVTTGTQD
jgi:hypothetical protein